MDRDKRSRVAVSLIVIVSILTLIIALSSLVAYLELNRSPSVNSRTYATSYESSQTYDTIFTTYTTVIRTTLPVGGSTYTNTTGLYSGCIPPVQCYLTTVTTEIIQSTTNNSSSTWYYSFPFSINYSGSWNLSYWGVGGTVTLGNLNGNNLNGTGDYENTITVHGLDGYTSELCANATKLDSIDNLTLTIAVSSFTNSTSNLSPSAKVCVSVAQ